MTYENYLVHQITPNHHNFYVTRTFASLKIPPLCSRPGRVQTHGPWRMTNIASKWAFYDHKDPPQTTAINTPRLFTNCKRHRWNTSVISLSAPRHNAFVSMSVARDGSRRSRRMLNWRRTRNYAHFWARGGVHRSETIWWKCLTRTRPHKDNRTPFNRMPHCSTCDWLIRPFGMV